MARPPPPPLAPPNAPPTAHPANTYTHTLAPQNPHRSVRASLVRGDLEPECALLAAHLVAPSLLPLRLAAHRAATLAARGALKARTAHAELVHGLSGSKHVESVWWWWRWC